MNAINVNTMSKKIIQILSALLLIAVAATGQASVESTTYILTDHLGSPILATDENGDVKWREDYQPFGTQIINEDGNNAAGFTGHLDDKTLNVTYMQGRWYHPEMGRFMAIDPVGFVEENPATFNRYSYGNNNPFKYIDPDGRANKSADEAWEAAGGPNPQAALADAAENIGAGGKAVSEVGSEIAMDPTNWFAPEKLLLKFSGIVGIGIKSELKVTNGAQKLARYDGPKPTYHVNPAHVPGQRGFNPKKTPLPKDAEDVFKNAVPNDPKNPTAWFGKNADGQIYRFSTSNDGTAHFSGIDGVGDGVRNLTEYALDRLNGL